MGTKQAKSRVTIYIDPELAERLWDEHARTRRPVSGIAERLMKLGDKQEARKGRAARAVPA